jgi:hypothetical protein
MRRRAPIQILQIAIGGDEFCADQAAFDKMIYGVVAATAYAENNDPAIVERLLVDKFNHFIHD